MPLTAITFFYGALILLGATVVIYGLSISVRPRPVVSGEAIQDQDELQHAGDDLLGLKRSDDAQSLREKNAGDCMRECLDSPPAEGFFSRLSRSISGGRRKTPVAMTPAAPETDGLDKPVATGTLLGPRAGTSKEGNREGS